MRSYQDAWFWADSTSRISIVSQYHIQIYLRNFRDNMAQPSCRKPWSLGWPNQSRRSRKNTNSHNMCCYPTRSPQTICKTLCDILLCLCWWKPSFFHMGMDIKTHHFHIQKIPAIFWERCVPSALAPSSPAHPAQKSSSKSPGCKILKTMNILNIPCLPLSIYVLLCKFDVSTYPMGLIDASYFSVYIYISICVDWRIGWSSSVLAVYHVHKSSSIIAAAMYLSTCESRTHAIPSALPGASEGGTLSSLALKVISWLPATTCHSWITGELPLIYMPIIGKTWTLNEIKYDKMTSHSFD